MAKIKNLLTGLTSTADEVAAITADASAMSNYVAAWQQTPEYTPKMLSFLANALQQSQVVASDFAAQGVALDGDDSSSVKPSVLESALLVQNLREMMARTVMQADADSQSFMTVMNCQRFMMTPPLAAYYVYLDAVSITDANVPTYASAGALTFRAALDSFSVDDFSTWRPVSIRQPHAGEATTVFTGAAQLRSIDTLVLHTPRRGFFTTPTFFAGWPTNTSNQDRLPVNQTMIVATGRAFDGDVPVRPPSLAALDAAHAAPGSGCFGCHVSLDPMRQFFRSTYTLYGSAQVDPNMLGLPGSFGFGPVAAVGTPGSIDVLAQTLATHPYIANAWVQKLCAYANDGACLASDAEVQRLGQVFASSGYRFSTLVNALFSSPVVTYGAATATGAALLDSLPVTKRDHLCPLLSSRLGIPDVCGLSATTQVQGNMLLVRTIAAVMPSDGYSRAAIDPVFANDPTLFYRAGLENICAMLAAQVVDTTAVAGAMSLSSKDVPGAIATLTGRLMGELGERAAGVATLLQGNYDDSVAAGESPTSALQSTFIAACLSPAVAGMAQ